mgnify:CR=1 FL=1|jgi:hypothetical protein
MRNTRMNEILDSWLLSADSQHLVVTVKCLFVFDSIIVSDKHRAILSDFKLLLV